jgi:putative membrane protein
MRPVRYTIPIGHALRSTGVMRLLRRLLYMWIFNVVALVATTQLVAGIDFDEDFGTLILTALVFAAVNLLLKPAVRLLALPVVMVTLGIALFFVNILMLYITDWIVAGFTIDSLGAAFWATIVIWGVNWVLQIVFDANDRARQRQET